MSSPAPEIWIIVPCYNEANRLPAGAFSAFAAAHPELGFCFVNDGSADGTIQVLQKLADGGDGRIIALDQSVNRGKAEAVRAGVGHVLVSASPKWIGYWDADLATPLEDIPRFRSLAEGREGTAFVLGSRVRRMGADIDRKPARHYLGRIFATTASAVLGLPVYDTQCGAKLIKADLAARIFDRPFVSRWLFDVELIARTICVLGRDKAAAALLEVPLDRWTEVGESRVKPSHFLKAPMELLKIRRDFKNAAGTGRIEHANQKTTTDAKK